MPSEAKFGISPQPPATCPLIDDAIKVIEKCLDLSRRPERSTYEELVSEVEDIHNELVDLVSGRYWSCCTMEKIRENVENVRKWGQEWKDLAKSLDDNYVDNP